MITIQNEKEILNKINSLPFVKDVYEAVKADDELYSLYIQADLNTFEMNQGLSDFLITVKYTDFEDLKQGTILTSTCQYTLEEVLNELTLLGRLNDEIEDVEDELNDLIFDVKDDHDVLIKAKSNYAKELRAAYRETRQRLEVKIQNLKSLI